MLNQVGMLIPIFELTFLYCLYQLRFRGLSLITLFNFIKLSFTISEFWIANASNNNTTLALLICLVYIVVSFIVGIIISKQKEIK